MSTIIPDSASVVLQKVREAINNRGQGLNPLAVTPAPTYEQLKAKQDTMVTAVSSNTARTSKSPGNSKYGTQNDPSDKPNKKLIIVDLTNQEHILLQYVPLELDYDPNSNFASIHSMGRNNPLYHYTGSEDILKFIIDWSRQSDDSTDVILNCRKLEALSKNDGFGNTPHKIKLLWHDSLFNDATWIVASAPYKLTLPDAQNQMLHTQAYQSVTLKRVTDTNLTNDEISSITN